MYVKRSKPFTRNVGIEEDKRIISLESEMIIATVENTTGEIYRIIGEDCTFSHYEKINVIKGYLESEEEEAEDTIKD